MGPIYLDTILECNVKPDSALILQILWDCQQTGKQNQKKEGRNYIFHH